MSAETVEKVFDINDWEEIEDNNVPLVAFQSRKISAEEGKSQETKNQQVSSPNVDITSQQIPNGNAQSQNKQSQQPQLAQQVMLVEYGKKYNKYKKYKELENFFSQNYENNLYFDPTNIQFISENGEIICEGTEGFQVGSTLLFDGKTKQFKGIGNLAYSIEISTTNERLNNAMKTQEDTFEEGQQKLEDDNQIIDADGQSKLNITGAGVNSSSAEGQQNQNNSIKDNAMNAHEKNNKNKLTALESIYDWIEKKDKLYKKRIRKVSKLQMDVGNTKQEGNQGEDTVTQKRTRAVPMNYILKKIKK